MTALTSLQQKRLNRSMPAAKRGSLGDRLAAAELHSDSANAAAIATNKAALQTLQANFNSLLTKLDADAGVTDTNYNSTLAVTPLT